MLKTTRPTIDLLSTTAIVIAATGFVLGNSASVSVAGTAERRAQLANPCGAANPCTPRPPAAPCSPGAADPCSPCAISAAAEPTSCTVPRLARLAAANPSGATTPCEPCAAASPCNPCAAASPCNPCAAASPCNPCAAASPCNPCAAANPCNPCAAGEQPPALSEAELIATYECVGSFMAAAYARSGEEVAQAYRGWTRFSRTAYPAEAHGTRFMNNYANDVGREAYGRYERGGALPAGSVLAKDSFVVTPDGAVAVGPLFVMAKEEAGYSDVARDWHYEMIMPDGAVRADAEIQAFCNDCHQRAGAEDDHLMFLPLPYRAARTSE